MGLQTAPAYIAQNIDTTDFQHPIELMRNLLRMQAGRASGVFKYGDFAVTTPGVGLTVNIAAGGAYLEGVESNTQGGYFAWSNASDSVNFGAPSASTRYDSIILRVADQQYGTIPGSPQAYFEVVAGAAGAGVARADSYFNTGGAAYVPGAWFRIADVKVDPGDTSVASNKITSNLRYLSAPGGMRLCTSTTRPSSPTYGSRIFEIDTALHYFYDVPRAAWRLCAPYRDTLLPAGGTVATFSNIPLGLKNIKIVCRARGTSVAGAGYATIAFNADGTAGNYIWNMVNQSGTNAAPANQRLTNPNYVIYIPSSTATTNRFGIATIEIMGVDNPGGQLGYYVNGGFVDASSPIAYFGPGTWTGTGPVTSISITSTVGNYATGTEFELFGWD